MIALNGYDPRLVRKLILITPFLGIPTGQAARRILSHYATMHPRVLPNPTSSYLEQIERVARDSNPRDVLDQFGGELTIFAAADDQVAPLKTIKALRPRTAKLVVLDGQTHEVEDRPGFKNLFCRELVVT